MPKNRQHVPMAAADWPRCCAAHRSERNTRLGQNSAAVRQPSAVAPARHVHVVHGSPFIGMWAVGALLEGGPTPCDPCDFVNPLAGRQAGIYPGPTATT